MIDEDTKTPEPFSIPEKIVWVTFLLLVFSIGFMQPYFFALNNRIVGTDLLFLLTFSLWSVFLIFRKLRFKWDGAFWVLIFYLGALLLSTLLSQTPYTSGIKYLSIIYLAGMAVLTANLVRSTRHLRHVFFVWIAATAAAAAVSLFSLILFYADRDFWMLNFTLSHYGTLPPGNYPRIQSTFFNPNMLCNYFSLGLMVILASIKLGWVKTGILIVLVPLFSIACIFTISPGIGGILLSLGIWFWLTKRHTGKNRRGATGLVLGIVFAVLFFASTVFTPIQSDTSTFHVVVPLIEKHLDPSSRLLAWQNSLKTFSKYPLTGKGIGTNVANVSYKNPSGRLESLEDAHQMWLNVLGQAGLPGFFAICWICFCFLRKCLPFGISDKKTTLMSALGIGFLSAFIYQGLTGSYEDARHLWVWIGLIIAVSHTDFLWADGKVSGVHANKEITLSTE